MPIKKNWKLRSSLISSFKACAYRCYLEYILNIVPDKDTDALRQGTNWHRLLEIMGMPAGMVCPECSKTQSNPQCPLCNGTDILSDDLMEAAVGQLNVSYEEVPVYKERAEWLTERAILLYSLAGYNWHYADDDYEVVATELYFELPLRNPETGRKLPRVVISGTIDKILKSPEGFYYIGEHKSTSKAIDSDSTYWNHLNLDTQTTLYPWAAQELQLAGDLEDYGIKATDPLIAGVRYDVWHKPQIKPKKLTQADSKKFVETGEYCGKKFDVLDWDTSDAGGMQRVKVGEEMTNVEPGAKEGTFAIRETPDMFGERLLSDISERPEFYFARKDLARTQADFERLQNELVNIYRTLKFCNKNDGFWKNERNCESAFKCPYTNLCYNNIEVGEDDVPEGFKKVVRFGVGTPREKTVEIVGATK